MNLVSNAIKFTREGGVTVNIYFNDKELEHINSMNEQLESKGINEQLQSST